MKWFAFFIFSFFLSFNLMAKTSESEKKFASAILKIKDFNTKILTISNENIDKDAEKNNGKNKGENKEESKAEMISFLDEIEKKAALLEDTDKSL